MAGNQEFPENRPRDQNGAPTPTPLQVKEDATRDARIAKEQARIKEGFASQPVAGHDRNREDQERGR